MKVRINVETDDVSINKGDICEVVQENKGTYFLKHNGMVLQMLKSDCEVVNENKIETKTIRITKNFNNAFLLKGDLLTAKFEEGERYILVKSGYFKGICINKDCFEVIKEEPIKQGFTAEFKKDCRNCKFDPAICDKNCDDDYKCWEKEVKFEKHCTICKNYNKIGFKHCKNGELELFEMIDNKNIEKESLVNKQIEKSVIDKINKLKNCTIEKDIELPNEFYFKYHNGDIDFKAILIRNSYEVYGVLNGEYYCYYDIIYVKTFIKSKEWIIIEPPVNKEKELIKDKIAKYREQQKQEVNKNCDNCKNNSIIGDASWCKKHLIRDCYFKNFVLWEDIKENNINELYEKIDDAVTVVVNNIIDNKKLSKFITLTTIEDFKVTIAKDKIVSVLQYEDKCFITTVAVEDIFTVRELAEDIIKMLDE